MQSFAEALDAILAAAPVAGIEEVPRALAAGRVVARDPRVPRDVPASRLAAVDGFALGPETGPSWRVVATIPAGRSPVASLTAGEAAAVMTGGLVPAGAERVVRVEDCREDGATVRVAHAGPEGPLINETAAEAAAGDPLLEPGTRLDATRYPVLCAAGVQRVEVFRTPRLGVLVTGGEVVDGCDGSDRLAPGLVFDANGAIVSSLAAAVGVPVARLLRVDDTPAALAAAVADLAADCQVIVTTGGISRGRFDLVPDVLRDAGFRALVDGIRMRPGRPLRAARRSDVIWLGLPGYPAACYTGALLLLVPLLKAASGRRDAAARPIRARLATPLHGRSERLDWCRVGLEVRDGAWIARDPGTQRSSHFLNFARVDGLAELPETVDALPAGAAVDVVSTALELT
ncbi:MAG: molybdopterin molybdotransferase MoeA [Candidatus Krumholzibacteriia bacterium]